MMYLFVRAVQMNVKLLRVPYMCALLRVVCSATVVPRVSHRGQFGISYAL